MKQTHHCKSTVLQFKKKEREREIPPEIRLYRQVTEF